MNGLQEVRTRAGGLDALEGALDEDGAVAHARQVPGFAAAQIRVGEAVVLAGRRVLTTVEGSEEGGVARRDGGGKEGEDSEGGGETHCDV